MADGKNSKDTPDQTAGPDENTTETTDVSSTGQQDVPVSAEVGTGKVLLNKDRDSDTVGSAAADEGDQKTEAEALDADTDVTPGSDASASDAAITTGNPTPDPWMEADAATNEGMANPPESELAPDHEDRSGLHADQGSDTPEEPTPTSTPMAEPEPRVIKETVVERKGGFLPMLLGGVAAAVIGYGYAQYQSNGWPFGAGTEDPFRAQTTATLDQQRAQLDDLTSRLGNTETVVGAFDVSDLTSAVAELGSSVTDLQSQIATVSEEVGSLQAQFIELEKRPMEAALSPEAVAAYQREMDALRSDIETQRSEISNFAAEAVAAEQSAEAQASLAMARAALAELTAALENGDPFEEQISMIQSSSGISVPAELSDTAEEGAPTLAGLVTDFPDAARAALAAARAEAAPEEGTSRVLTFFRDQVGARSVTPREGMDADAVLSRAEAALNSGDLATALSEVKTLDTAAQAAMSDWIARAEARFAAQGAAATLAQELNQE